MFKEKALQISRLFSAYGSFAQSGSILTFYDTSSSI